MINYHVKLFCCVFRKILWKHSHQISRQGFALKSVTKLNINLQYWWFKYCLRSLWIHCSEWTVPTSIDIMPAVHFGAPVRPLARGFEPVWGPVGGWQNEEMADAASENETGSQQERGEWLARKASVKEVRQQRNGHEKMSDWSGGEMSKQVGHRRESLP